MRSAATVMLFCCRYARKPKPNNKEKIRQRIRMNGARAADFNMRFVSYPGAPLFRALVRDWGAVTDRVPELAVPCDIFAYCQRSLLIEKTSHRVRDRRIAADRTRPGQLLVRRRGKALYRWF